MGNSRGTGTRGEAGTSRDAGGYGPGNYNAAASHGYGSAEGYSAGSYRTAGGHSAGSYGSAEGYSAAGGYRAAGSPGAGEYGARGTSAGPTGGARMPGGGQATSGGQAPGNGQTGASGHTTGGGYTSDGGYTSGGGHPTGGGQAAGGYTGGGGQSAGGARPPGNGYSAGASSAGYGQAGAGYGTSGGYSAGATGYGSGGAPPYGTGAPPYGAAGQAQDGTRQRNGRYTGPGSGARSQPDSDGPQRRPMQYGLLGEPSPVHQPGDAASKDRDRAGGIVIRQRDSALPERPPSGAIAAIEADNLESFARDLRAMRSKAGLDYPEMAEVSHYTMRTLASAAGGLRLPTLPVTVAYVQACGGDIAEWEERWAKLAKTLKMDPKALPAAGSSATGPEPGDPPSVAQRKMPPPPRDDGAVYVITSAKSREERW